MSDKKNNLRRVVITLLVCLVGLLLWLALRETRRSQAVRPQPKSERAESVTYTPLRTPDRKTAFDPTKLPPFTDKEPAPVIDKVEVEKTEVCEGEENLITIKAHTENGTDSFLHYAIGASSGMPMPLRTFLSGDTPMPQTARVFGRGNVVTEVDLSPYYKVKKCQVERFVNIQYRLGPNTFSEFDFSVDVREYRPSRDPNAKPFRPVQYRWSFGDETTAVTTVPYATHNYDDRPQESMYSHFVVAVEVTAESGEKAIGRRVLPLMNPAFEDLAFKGIVTIMTIPTQPRFPEVDEGGNVTQGFRLWHARPDPVAITKITVTRIILEANKEGFGGAKVEQGDVVKILGQHDIPPGKGLEIAAAEKAKSDPNWSMITFTLEGESAEGWPARGAFSLMMPTAMPTRDRHEPVTDPLLAAKILAAQKLLGKQFVSDEDIRRLEQEGLLKGVSPVGNLNVLQPKDQPSRTGGPGASGVSGASGGAPPPTAPPGGGALPVPPLPPAR